MQIFNRNKILIRSILIGLFVIGIIIYILFYHTEYGRQYFCYRELLKINIQIDTMKKNISHLDSVLINVQPVQAICGDIQDYEGFSEPKDFTYTLGTTSGEVLVIYDMYEIPDRMELILNGERVAATDYNKILNIGYSKYKDLYAAGSDTLRFNYQYDIEKINELIVRVIPNPDFSTTQWQFKVICPQ